METAKGVISTVKFTVPSGLTSATFKVYRAGTQVGATVNATITGTVAEAALPYAAVVETGSLTAELSFVFQSASYTQNQYVEVVTPYLEPWEVLAVWPEATSAEATEVEAAVRHIINAHCGQDFGYIEKAVVVEGHGEDALLLPARLIELTALATQTEQLDPNASIIVSDGWYLKKRWADEIATLETTDLYFGEDTRPGGIVYAPSLSGTASKWRDDYPFTITGKWGYLYVPAAVKEAAKLLVNDYACSEIAFRDRYLESMKAADWRLQFNMRAWEATGNARADQLLSEYVLLDWAVV